MNGSDPRAILEAYASDYVNDVMLEKDVTFGVKVDENFWTVVAKAKTDELQASVIVQEGKPTNPTFYFKTRIGTLDSISQGKMNPLTAAAAAFSFEKVPLDADVMEGFQPDESFMTTLLSVYFHFWTKGTPEIIPYGLDLTRFTHGAQASVFYYQPGFRSAYVALKKGQHANKDERSQTNPFPTLLIAIKGEGIARINGVDTTFSEGNAMLIPKGVRHEFLNPDNEAPFECILIMFGEGA
jgi:quercetin dioxygenase-like cupin family protein